MEILRSGICLIGYGKMGRMIDELLLKRGRSINGIIQSQSSEEERIELFQRSAVAIEFTEPASAVNNMLQAISNGCAVVCGTTGWQDRQRLVFDEVYKNHGALIYASNFSTGVHVFIREAAKLASQMKRLKDYIPGIEETHHIHKKDAPSGTAISLAEAVLPSYPAYKGWSLSDEVSGAALPISCYREDEVPGTHHLVFRSGVDEIVLTHRAFGRAGFAAGAITAADWIVGKKGVFGIQEMLSDLQTQQ